MGGGDGLIEEEELLELRALATVLGDGRLAMGLGDLSLYDRLATEIGDLLYDRLATGLGDLSLYDRLATGLGDLSL